MAVRVFAREVGAVVGSVYATVTGAIVATPMKDIGKFRSF